MVNTFFVVLPSNVSDYPNNRPNKYRVHLPKSIEFQGGNWVCGLYSIQYPQSWAATIGTNEKQWIQINYKQKEALKLGIPKTTQLTPKGLSFFLKLALARIQSDTHRKRREILEDDIEDNEIIISPEIDIIGTPSKKRLRRETINLSKLEEIQKQGFVDGFFLMHATDYWDGISTFEHELEVHKLDIEKKTKEIKEAKDPYYKAGLQEHLDHLNSLSEEKKENIAILKEEARKRDNLDKDKLQINF